jgi:crotonobetainyl-CoA:carnitine CoA-transferase CaiB-like acyl-CoA transferase
MSLPLEGVRVLDGTWLLASGGGPRYLSALGAEVLRLEWKGSIDFLRFSTVLAPKGGREERRAATEPIPPTPTDSLNRGGYFNDINAGRRGFSLNMHHPKGKELFKRLLAVSDVFAEGFTATTLERWNLPFSEMLKINPRLVYCQQPGFGFHGRYRDYRVVGPVAQAVSGITELNGLPEPYPPAGWGYSYLDWGGAYNLALGILAGLHYQRRTGKGIWIDSSQAEAGISYTGTAILDHQANGRSYRRTGNRSPHKLAAPHGAYQCGGRDRWLAIAVFTEDDWSRFCSVLERPAWTADPRFATLALRLENEADLDRNVEAWTCDQDPFEAMQRLQEAGVRAGVCQTSEDRVDHDPQLQHLEWLVELPQSEIGTWPIKDVPIKFSRTPAYQGGIIGRASPSYGEDNHYVYGDILGLSPAEIQGLADDDVI